MARYFLAFSEKQYHVSFQRILKKFNFSFLPLWFWLVQVRRKGIENTIVLRRRRSTSLA